MHVKSAYRKKQIDPHYFQRGGARRGLSAGRRCRQSNPANRHQGCPHGRVLAPLCPIRSAPLFPIQRLKGGYNPPINLNQANPMTQAMAAQQRPQEVMPKVGSFSRNT